MKRETISKFNKRISTIDVKELNDQDVSNLLHLLDHCAASGNKDMVKALKTVIKEVGFKRCRECFLIAPNLKELID